MITKSTAIVIIGSFILLWVNQAIFTHSHLVGDQLIIHAHPYQQSDNPTPDHQHSEGELTFYQNLHHIVFILLAVGILWNTYPKISDYVCTRHIYPVISFAIRHCFNKAPPIA
ncbi:MAG: hypothetical protein ACOCXH_02105 [Cyclobacteriaceae bacterium]